MSEVGLTSPCKNGCFSCCIGMDIFTFPAEIIFIVREIENNKKSSSIKRSIEISKATDGEEKVKCSLLSQGSCSVYPVRPLACRCHVGVNKQECDDYSTGATNILPEVGVAPLLVKLAVIDVFKCLINEVYELNSILERIYSDKNKLNSWVKGIPTYEPDLLRGLYHR